MPRYDVIPSHTYDIFDEIASKEPKFKHTILSPKEEKKFQKEFTSSPWYKDFVMRNKEDPLNNPDYDYRGAWKGGALDINTPQTHGLSRDPSTKKWLKDPRTHDTAWKEYYMEKTGVNPDEANLSRGDAAIQMESYLKLYGK
tara:strand:- start:75 stop:500 length:426 start_codon:yes stop_codon:yes gene_type:complete